MVNPAWFFVGAIAVAEIYKKYSTPQEKFDWENWIKLHHGEVGAVAAVLGLATKSPRLTAVGLGLAAHDIADMPKWFSGDKTGVKY